MLDIKFVRENPEVVKQNIRNKFQDNKLELVDKVLELDKENREIKQEVEVLRAERNKISKQIGALMGQGKKDEAEEVKAQVAANAARLSELEAQEKELSEKVTKIMMTIPNIIDPSVPIGRMTAATWRSKNSVIHMFRISKSHIIRILWSVLTELISMLPERLPETDFIT